MFPKCRLQVEVELSFGCSLAHVLGGSGVLACFRQTYTSQRHVEERSRMETKTDRCEEPLGEQLDAIESALLGAEGAVASSGAGYGYFMPNDQPSLYDGKLPSGPQPSGLAPSPTPVTGGGNAPLPKRPKGRILAFVIVLLVFGFAGHAVWNEFLRFEAYGEVVGRTVAVSPPWSGVLKTLHVREGDVVRQGQLLVTTESLELNQRLEKLSDELKVSQAQLTAEVAEWKLSLEVQREQDKLASAQFYEMWGNLLQERSKLHELQAGVERAESLARQDAISTEECEALRFRLEGQQAKVEKMKTAVTEMHSRVEDGNHADALAESKSLQPQFARLEALQRDLERLRKQAHQGSIHAPVNGRVVRVTRHPGEYAGEADPILEILAEGSTEIIVYLEQRDAELLQVGQNFSVNVEPSRVEMKCRVTRLGESMVSAPQPLERYYAKNALLLPVHARVGLYIANTTSLRPGMTVRLPRGSLVKQLQESLTRSVTQEGLQEVATDAGVDERLTNTEEEI